jgi:hypothetical protein
MQSKNTKDLQALLIEMEPLGGISFGANIGPDAKIVIEM